MQNLSLDLQELMFTYSTMGCTDEERQRLYRTQLKEAEEMDTDKFKKMGYSEEDLAEIMQGLQSLKQ